MIISESYPPLRSLADVEALERIPFDDRVDGWNFGDILLSGCRRSPEKWAIHYVTDGDPETSPVSLRYDALHRAAVQAANLFHATNIGPEDTVMFALPCVPELVIGLMGAFSCCIGFPVNWMLSPAKLLNLVNAVKPKAIVTLGPTPGYRIWEGVRSIHNDLPDGVRIFSIPGPGGEPDKESDFTTQAADMRADALDFERTMGRADIAAYLHSGGTTGAPKVVALTHRGFAYRTWATNYSHALTPDEVLFLDWPMFHVGGLATRGLVTIASGQTVIIPSPAGARDLRYISNYWKFVERFRITRLSGVPTTLSLLLKTPVKDADISSLRKQFGTGSTRLALSVHKGVEELFGIRPLVFYGMTETIGSMTFDPRDGPTKYGSVGIRLPYAKLRSIQLTPDNQIARDCEPSETGTIICHSPGLTTGYLEAGHTAESFVDGWFNTGDFGYFDDDGYVWLTGRAKAIINRGGHNIDPAQIEEALLSSPDVVLAVAVGMPDAYAGEVPVAYVQLASGATASSADLLTFARARIFEQSARPLDIFIVDKMPLTNVGKPGKLELRNDAAQRTFTKSLAQLDIQSLTVQVTEDQTHGSLATIILPDIVPGSVDTFVAEIMNSFSIEWRIERVTEPPVASSSPTSVRSIFKTIVSVVTRPER